MLKIYSLLSYIFIPIILINLFLRLLNNKEDKIRFTERLGKSKNRFQQKKKILWLHAASLGEFKSSDLIIQKYYKQFNILVTTTTMTSAKYVTQHYKSKVIHQYIPFDVPSWCKKFIDYWKPSLILWIESDIWPNMLKIIKNNNINSFYVNARISPKSYKKWKYFKNLYSSSLTTFTKILAQSPNDLRRIEDLSSAKINYIGNLKLSNIKNNDSKIDSNKTYKLMIVSSHESEEEKIIKSLENFIKNNKIKLCIAPRHLERISKIFKVLKKYKLSYALSDEDKSGDKDVLIINTIGSLDKYFSKSEIIILGGSFISKGGHNPLEPAKFGCVLISGNLVYNWENVYDEMARERACIMVNDVNKLDNIIDELMSNRSLIEDYKKRALDFSNKNFFDSEALFKEINLVLN